MLKMAVNILLLALLPVAAISLWMRLNEPRMIYFPERALATTPQQLGMKYEDIWLTAADGVRINGWFMPSSHPSGLTVLMLHGNAGNISHRFEKYAVFHQLGWNIFALDYRGYGNSAGEPDEAGLYLDARAAYRYLIEQRGVDPRKLIVYGESLGTAIAVDLLSEVTAAGLVLEEGFTSAPDAGQEIYPFLPVRWLMRSRYDSLSKIGRIRTRLLIFHSREDEFFPMHHAQKLLAAAPSPKELVELRGGHNDAFVQSGEIYQNALRHFADSMRNTLF
ncbi:MAG: alpha/beta hydrolase [Gallionellaceae bacterium]|nr:alpha/beta hydrolase [Gallionellaceae bacterium]